MARVRMMNKTASGAKREIKFYLQNLANRVDKF